MAPAVPPSFPGNRLFRQGSTGSNRSGRHATPGRSTAPGEHLQDVSFGSSNRHSSHSSLSASRSAQSRSRDPPVLRSQYPADSMEAHVEYILVASFDIDRGSVMEHQYPGPISGDEHMLAELMLPDQAHVRSSDWTIFFLHKDTTAEEEAREERRERRLRRQRRKEMLANGEIGPDDDEFDNEDYDDDSNTDDDDDETEGPPLIYVLNLVNTKQDNTVKRGAIVKAMAICTRHSFLHIYKPLLLLALEEYFRNPELETLASLYNAVNSMDLSLMPRLSQLERNILQNSDAKDMFVEKFRIMIEQRMAEDARSISQASHSSTSSPSRNKSSRYQLPRDTHEFESKVLYNGVPVPIKVPVAISAETVGDFSLVKLITTFSNPHASQPQPFPHHPHLTTSGPYTHPIIVLINALLTQKRVIFLGHNQPSGSVAEAVLAACALASGGILKGFTRHAFPYTDLTKIDDLLKVPGFIAGVTNPAFAHKPEWWDLLCDLPTGRMKISHKIAGAPITNGLLYFQQGGPGFNAAGYTNFKDGSGLTNGSDKHHHKDKDHSHNSHNDPSGDTAFMEAVLSSISNRHGEAAIRTKFRNWVNRFTLIAAAFEEVVYGASAVHIGASETDHDRYGYGVVGHGLVWPDEQAKMREIGANVGRVEGWRQSRSYSMLIGDLARRWEREEMVHGIDLGYQVERLRTLKVGDLGAGKIYQAVSRAVERVGREGEDAGGDDSAESDTEAGYDEAQETRVAKSKQRKERARYEVINQLLCALPETCGGLFYISLGLFHKDFHVRMAVVRLLERIMVHEAGRHYWASLGKFAKLAYVRVKGEAELIPSMNG